MKRYGSVLGLKPEAVADYVRVHAAVWPDVLKQIRNSNIRNYSIFLSSRKTCCFRISSMSAPTTKPIWPRWPPIR